MLLSEAEERGRRFKLALRAGIPILLLIALILYAIFLKSDSMTLISENSFLIAGIAFISIYFIYFLLEQDAQETLLDDKTKGFNKKSFAQKVQSSNLKTISMLKINNLASINENYGATEADRLLHSTVARLNQVMHEHGLDKAVIGRHYGAEFLIAIEGKETSLKDALEKFIKDNHTINSIEIDYRFSIATYTDEDLEKTIIHLQDTILSYNKPQAIVDKKQNIQDISQISKTEADIIRAIEDNRLAFTFRPLLNVKTDTVDIYEVSVRLKSDKSGDILPRTYLPIINRLGLGMDYDFAIIKHLIDLLPLLDKQISFTFNISPFSLRNRDFQNRFFAYLDKSEIDASRLIIELYERKAHHNLSNYFQTLNFMRTKGVRIAIDNFGSSNASMEYMKHFRFDMVQFDRDFVTKLEDKITYEMLHSLIEMSKNLNIKTVAKWVDKDRQKTKLLEIGIDYVQGFGIGKPILEKELIDLSN